MKTEQDIRIFMQENRIPLPKDDAFMADLVRQMNMLPERAAVPARNDERIQENISMLKMVTDALRKHNRKEALKMLVMSVVICMALYVTGYFVIRPDILTGDSAAVQFILQWRYMLMGFASLAVMAATIGTTDLVRI